MRVRWVLNFDDGNWKKKCFEGFFAEEDKGGCSQKRVCVKCIFEECLNKNHSLFHLVFKN